MTEDIVKDDPDQLTRIENTTFDELDAFYAEMGTEHACENCKTERWSHLCDDAGPVSLRLPSFNRTTVFSIAFVITCDRCGNMRFTNGGAVLSWLDSKEGQ
jgi:hypothetical protein